ncbi:hypothetical protein D3C78_962710 [compost metagenome]
MYNDQLVQPFDVQAAVSLETHETINVSFAFTLSSSLGEACISVKIRYGTEFTDCLIHYFESALMQMITYLYPRKAFQNTESVGYGTGGNRNENEGT